MQINGLFSAFWREGDVQWGFEEERLEGLGVYIPVNHHTATEV
jgi:hypothetical protein